MADADGAGIFMFFEHDGGLLAGECTTELRIPGRPTHELLNGFTPGKMFEVTKFDFGVGVEQEALEEALDPRIGEALASVPGYTQPRSKPRRKARTGPPIEGSAVTPQPSTFSRSMDAASYLLLHHTIKRTFFKRAVLVKRKSAGGKAAGEPYLRMDFTGVLLIDASWNNDDPIEEEYSFQARAITMRYRPQLPNGSLGATRIGFWSMALDEREAQI